MIPENDLSNDESWKQHQEFRPMGQEEEQAWRKREKALRIQKLQNQRDALQTSREILQTSRETHQAVSESEAWAHWEYSPEEWALFEEIDWKGASRKFWLFAGLSTLFLPDVVLLVLSGTYDWYPLLASSIVLLVVFIFVFIVTAIYGYKYSEARKRHRARQNQAQTQRITIAKRGIWEAGAFFPLDGLDMVLDAVKITHQPLVLSFTRTKQFWGEETTPQSDTLRIFVPHRYEDEAMHLVQRFRTEVIDAQAQARERDINPPEPD